MCYLFIMYFYIIMYILFIYNVADFGMARKMYYDGNYQKTGQVI
jgi:hypothetical protein